VKGSSKGWIGLDMGHRSIAVAQLERVAGAVRLLAAAEMPRTAIPPAGGSSEDHYTDVSKQEIETAKRLAQRLSGRAAACVLPMSVTDLTHESLPPGDPSEQHAMIANELRSGERLQFDFWPSTLMRDGQTSTLADVNVIAIPETRANNVAEKVTAARMDCRVLDGLPHAVARAVAMALPESFGGSVGGLHLAYDNALFVLSRDGAPVFARQLRDGGIRQIVAQVSESLGLLEGEALHVLREFGLPTTAPSEAGNEQIQDVVGEIVTELLDGIADELTRTLAYLSSLGSMNVPDSICLLGEGAAIRNLPQSLSAKIDSSIWNWNLPGAAQYQSSEPPAAVLAVAAALSSLAWES
jgi:type IV pilus assembly protein PilM